jgi:adenylate cyclase
MSGPQCPIQTEPARPVTTMRIEKSKSDALLLNILSAGVVDRMRLGEVAIADHFPDATILFADLVGFTSLASGCSTARIIEIPNYPFSAIDALAKSFNLEKIKTIGDAYLLAGGLPDERPDHAIAVADVALGMIDIVRETGKQFRIALSSRIGIHSGDVVAGIIGQYRFYLRRLGRYRQSGKPVRVHKPPQPNSNFGGHVRKSRGNVSLRTARANRS